jgi:hypothetical protein
MVTELLLGGDHGCGHRARQHHSPGASAVTENGSPGGVLIEILIITRDSSIRASTPRMVSNLCPYAIDAVRRSRSPTIWTKPGTLTAAGLHALLLGQATPASQGADVLCDDRLVFDELSLGIVVERQVKTVADDDLAGLGCCQQAGAHV